MVEIGIVCIKPLFSCKISHLFYVLNMAFRKQLWSNSNSDLLSPTEFIHPAHGFHWPGRFFARVKRVESFATKQEENTKAASFLCSWASSFSMETWKLLVPEMFRVPPAPAPWFSRASLRTAMTKNNDWKMISSKWPAQWNMAICFFPTVMVLAIFLFVCLLT